MATTYLEMKSRQQSEFNSLPTKHCGFGSTKAECERKFYEMLASWGLKPCDADKVEHIGGGLSILKTDLHLLDEALERWDKESTEFFADSDNIKQALIYEFANYECCIGWRFDEALAATGLDIKDCIRDGRNLFEEARKEYLASCEY